MQDAQTQNNQKPLKCQRVIGGLVGFTGTKILSIPLRCNQWTCPACQIRLKKQLRKRILQGRITQEGVPKYGLKFLTLTYGGRESREKHILRYDENGPVYNASEIYSEMSTAFNDMITALMKFYGKFRYFRVTELHKDGVPHFHVLLAGKNIVPIDLLSHIENLWRFKYGFGFVKLNTPYKATGKHHFNNAKHAVNYMLKYITKDVLSAGKYKRVFSASRDALLKKIKGQLKMYHIVFGHIDDKGIKEETLYFTDQDTLTPAEIATIETMMKRRMQDLFTPERD